MTLRIGLIGAGVMGADHARILRTQFVGAELAAVHDPERDRAGRVAQVAPACVVFDDGLALIRDPKVDAVIVAAPDETHAPLVLACIEQRKPVLCEKPLAATLDQCRAIVAAEVRGGRRLVQVGYMRRFDPGYRALEAAVATGELGAPLFLHCVHRNAVGPAYLTSELVIANSTVHDIDAARYLLGDEFGSVSVTSPRASAKAPARQPHLLVLETKAGVVVDIEAFVDAQYGYDVRAELVCEEGTVSLAPNPPVSTNADGRNGVALFPDWRGRFAHAYREQLRAWIEAITNGRSNGASAWDGYVASATAAAALGAWRAGAKRAVALEPAPDFYRQTGLERV
jgi:myo-inositol 2-dehydrogenase/D-chiro-inositol 1-dehydrogenase